MQKNSCLVVFTPKQPQNYNNRKRFFVTLNTLQQYIGSGNAESVLFGFNSARTDKCTFKFRKYGKIEIYVK